MIGNIQHVLNIKRNTNRVTSFLVHALYNAIHFMIISNVQRAIATITNVSCHSIEIAGSIIINIINKKLSVWFSF